MLSTLWADATWSTNCSHLSRQIQSRCSGIFWHQSSCLLARCKPVILESQVGIHQGDPLGQAMVSICCPSTPEWSICRQMPRYKRFGILGYLFAVSDRESAWRSTISELFFSSIWSSKKRNMKSFALHRQLIKLFQLWKQFLSHVINQKFLDHQLAAHRLSLNHAQNKLKSRNIRC